MTLAPIRVIKLGGSLLDTVAVEQLPGWLDKQTAMINVLVVGGGQRVDEIRDSQRERGLDDQQAHWLSIQAMDFTARLVHQRLVAQGHSVKIVDSIGQLVNGPLKLFIFLVEDFLRYADQRPHHPLRQNWQPLPEDWTVTSDSIAAGLTVLFNAAELVLLKSKLPARGASLAELSAAGFVDAYFPHVAQTTSIRAVNARHSDWPETIPQRCRPSSLYGLGLRNIT